jgi:hypothetical protein
MAEDPFEAALDGFEQWSATTKQKLSCDPAVAVDELQFLLDLMRSYLEIDRPADLGEGDFKELLLRIYPRKMTVFDPADIEGTIPAIRDFLTYLTERGEMGPDTARALERELDQVAPLFTDAVMDDDADFDLKEAFGLPDQLPPIRLPAAAELAAMARRAPMIAELRALAGWLGAGRAVDEDAGMTGDEVAEAAAALGLAVPRFEHLWELAIETEFVEVDDDETGALPGEIARAWDAGDDEEVLGTWNAVFEAVIDATLDIAASLDPDRAEDLDFYGHGAAIVVMLFLARPEGLPVAEASEVIRSTATQELAPARAEEAWRSWTGAHGDPARLLLDHMAELGAVQLTDTEDGAQARFTALGLAATRAILADYEVDIPLLPPPAQMTAAELIAMTGGASEEEFTAEIAAWLTHQTAESAARELLAVAARSDPAGRILAVGVVITELGAAAEPAWRTALAQVELRGYANAALAALAAGDPAEGEASGVELADDDVAWMITDALAAEGWDEVDEDAEHEPAVLAERLAESIPAGQELTAFEMMARVPHPDVANVLTVIGRYHPDKRVAKLARTSADKAASRPAAPRR